MIKKIGFYICLMVASCWLLACSSDVEPSEGGAVSGKSVDVELRLGVSSNALVSTRASSEYSDANSLPGELMRNWFVVIVDKDNKIVNIKRNDPYDENEYERAQDEYWQHLSVGTYTFYSFANMQPSDVGLSDYKVGDVLPTGFFENQKYSVKIPTLTYTDKWSDYDKNYFPKGIPMSNKQVVTITADTRTVDLLVIRMVAKVKLELTNQTTHDITIKGLTLSDVTPNDVDNNLMLLPNDVETDGQGCMHVSKPNLAISDNQKTVETYSASSQVNDYVLEKNGKLNVCFYMNESEATEENKYFVLQLKTKDNDNTSTKVNRRLAMLDWRQICRNDYRIIPITLDDYAIEWQVESFTPIGVSPVVVDDGDNLTVTLGHYGEFHIVPKVRELSTDLPATVVKGSISWVEGSKSIFDVEPKWNETSKRVEGEMSNISGSCIYKLQLTAAKSNSSEHIVLTRKVRIVKK